MPAKSSDLVAQLGSQLRTAGALSAVPKKMATGNGRPTIRVSSADVHLLVRRSHHRASGVMLAIASPSIATEVSHRYLAATANTALAFV